MDRRLRTHLKCELEHGLRGGTTMEQLVQELTLPGLSHSLVEQALGEPRSIVHYLTMDHITTLWLAKGKHIMTLVACLPLLLATFENSNDFYPLLRISIFLGSYDNEMCTTYVVSTFITLTKWYTHL